MLIRPVYRALTALLVVAGLMSVGCSSQTLYSVDSVQLVKASDRATMNGKTTLTITAKGKTRTKGWTNIRLQPAGFNDGIYTFELRGDAPTDPSRQDFTDVEASYVINSIPSSLKGVKIRTETNTVTSTAMRMLSPTSSDNGIVPKPTKPAKTPETPEAPETPKEPKEPQPPVDPAVPDVPVKPQPQFKPKPKPEPAPKPAPKTPSDLEDALEK